jgi:hypothetical protein
LWEVAVADEVEGVTVGETVVTEIVAAVAVAVAGDSHWQKENRGYAAGQKRLVQAEGPNFVLCGGSEGRVQDTLGQCSVEGERM